MHSSSGYETWNGETCSFKHIPNFFSNLIIGKIVVY